MKYHWLLPLISAVLNAALGIGVISRARRERLNQVFFLMSLALTLWNLNNFVFYAFKDPARAMWWGNLLRTGTLVMPSTALHLVLTLATAAPPFSGWMLALSYGVSAALVAANSFGLLVSGVQRYPWGLYPVGTHLYGVYIAAAVANGTAALALLVREYRNTASPRRKLQARFWLVGAVVLVPASLGNFLPILRIPVYPIGHLGTTAYAAIIAYAIVRHRLMDIDVVLTKSAAYVLVSLVLVLPTFLAVLWLERATFGGVSVDFSFAILIMLIAIGVLFPGLRTRAESRIERSLFREKHEYRAALVAFTRSIVRILERERLTAELGKTLSTTLRLHSIAVALRSDQSRHLFTTCYTTGPTPQPIELSESGAFIGCLARRQAPVLRQELEESRVAEDRAAAETCRQHGWEVCIPLTVGAKLIGLIALGRKQNLDAFSAEDLDLLETLAAEASVALENARLYEELKKSQDIIRRADRLSALGTLAAGIAHEVRNPLVSIQTFFQLAPDRLHDEEFLTTFLGMTANEVKRISDLITELLSFARSPTRSLGPLSLNEAVDRVVTLLEPEAKKHRLTINRVFAQDVPLVHADADQIKQVLINLILNAIQATRPGGSVSIATRAVQHHQIECGQIEIRDTGVGIPKEQLNDIFNPFFTTKDKGTGLGLAITHQIVAEHGGSIAVHSREYEGTTILVDLPAGAQSIQSDAPDRSLVLPEPAPPRKIA